MSGVGESRARALRGEDGGEDGISSTVTVMLTRECAIVKMFVNDDVTYVMCIACRGGGEL